MSVPHKFRRAQNISVPIAGPDDWQLPYTRPEGGYARQQPGGYFGQNDIAGAPFQDPRMSTNFDVARRGTYAHPTFDQQTVTSNANAPAGAARMPNSGFDTTGMPMSNPAANQVVDLGANGSGVYRAPEGYMLPGGALVHSPQLGAPNPGFPYGRAAMYGAGALGVAGLGALAFNQGNNAEEQRMASVANSLSPEDLQELQMLLSNTSM